MKFTKSELFTVYNRMRWAIIKGQSDLSLERLNKALGILQSKNYFTNEKQDYQPTTEWCNCKDWEYRFASKRKYTGACKHIIAKQMEQAILEYRAEHTVVLEVHIDMYGE